MLIEQFTELLQQDQADLHQYLHGFLIKNKNTDGRNRHRTQELY